MGIENNLEICDSSSIFLAVLVLQIKYKTILVLPLSLLSGNFYGSEIRHGIFSGLNFGPVFFGGFDFCPHSIIPVT